MAIVLAAILLFVVGYLVFRPVERNARRQERQARVLALQLQLAASCFTSYLLPFEVTSILLLVAMIGAIVLTMARKKEDV